MKILLGLTEINQKFGPAGYQHGLGVISAVLKRSSFVSILLARFTGEWDPDA